MQTVPLRPAFLALAAIAVTLPTVVAGSPPPAGAPGPQDAVPVLVSTDWVAAHRADPDVLLLHVGMYQMDPPGAFIPGAVALEYHDIESSAGLSVEMPAAEQLAAVFAAAGVTGEEHVVLYGGGAAHIAARAFVALDYLGHPRVSVMDGGIETWQRENRPTVAQASSARPGAFAPMPDPAVLADAQWILARLDDPAVAVIDARPADQFAGRSSRNLREGHIPGAGNIYFVELLESEDLPRLKSLNEVEALFAAAGYTPGATVVSYCQIGMRASYNYLIARHLGYDVKLYDGSWQEWGADESLPAETGTGRQR